MSSFLATVPNTMTTGMDLTHYTETSGFLDKSKICLECGIIYDTRIVCNSAKDRDIVLQKLAAVAEHAEQDEEGTYTFLVLKSLDNDYHVRIFERYANWEAMEVHKKADKVVKFWLGSKAEVKSMEGRAYVPNGKGWLHH
jgi:quinol monooxygenase YgiN